MEDFVILPRHKHPPISAPSPDAVRNRTRTLSIYIPAEDYEPRTKQATPLRGSDRAVYSRRPSIIIPASLHSPTTLESPIPLESPTPLESPSPVKGQSPVQCPIQSPVTVQSPIPIQRPIQHPNINLIQNRHHTLNSRPASHPRPSTKEHPRRHRCPFSCAMLCFGR